MSIDYPATQLGQDAVQAIIGEYIKTGCDIARAGLGTRNEPDIKARQVVDEIQHLQLAEPWLPAMKILDALKLAGWIEPTEEVTR